MAEYETIHSKEGGEQVTHRVVTTTDATGQEFEYRFLVTDDGHEYLGDGDAPESATEALPDE